MNLEEYIKEVVGLLFGTKLYIEPDRNFTDHENTIQLKVDKMYEGGEILSSVQVFLKVDHSITSPFYHLPMIHTGRPIVSANDFTTEEISLSFSPFNQYWNCI